MDYNGKKKDIERNIGRIYDDFDVHGMLTYVSGYDSIQDIPDTIREGFHVNHERALAALSELTKARFKELIDKDYNALFNHG